MFQYILAAALILHGLANLGGVAAPFTSSGNGFSNQHWVFSSGVVLHSMAGKTYGLVWLLSTILLVASGLGLIRGQPWWLTAAIAGSATSFLAIAPWWGVVPPGARFGAIFDVLMLVLLLSPLGIRIAESI